MILHRQHSSRRPSTVTHDSYISLHPTLIIAQAIAHDSSFVLSGKRWTGDQAKQTYPISPQSNYASTLKNLNIRTDAKTVVIGQSAKLDTIGKYGTNVVGFVDESSNDLTDSIRKVLEDALPWVLYVSTEKASPVLEALKCATQVQIPLVVCSTPNFEKTEMDELRAILDKSSMTRLLGPGSSVFAAPHSGFAVWDKPIEDVKPGTIGILGSGYESIVDAVRATDKYGQSAIFDLGPDPRAGTRPGTRPWEVAEWLFSDDGTEIILVLGNGNPEMQSEVAAVYKAYVERTPDNQRRKRMVGIINDAGRKEWEDAGILVARDTIKAISLIERETSKISEKREDVAETTDQNPKKVSVTDLDP
ncbi:hypothetical protein QFC20_005128 [Naganishia adeliensis]|uniref:Uncharacterized protein n=1 Tax=Naganishia adeliensis TaxID=92952 RepID=A0ACC2VRC9_9TREE|nr:hypothetical protein QFC20_005128 [Naganishia adeliensis]